MTAPRYCRYCGAQIPGKGRFCPRCGKELEGQPAHQKPQPAGLDPGIPPAPVVPNPYQPPLSYPDLSENQPGGLFRSPPLNKLPAWAWIGAAAVLLLCLLLPAGLLPAGVFNGSQHTTATAEALSLTVTGVAALLNPTQAPGQARPTPQALTPGSVTATPVPVSSSPTSSAIPSPSPAAPADTWLVMLYFNADDKVLEENILFDLNEAELVGSSQRVTIVSQLERYKGGYAGDGNWSGARRFLVKQDNDLEHLHSELIEDLGEVDMGAIWTLVDFTTWATQTYPAQRRMLVISDHGGGWRGISWDDTPNEGSYLKTNDLDQALGKIVSQTGIGQLDLVAMDACLMSMLEVASGIAPYTRYFVGSEEVIPGMGLAYAGFLAPLAANPGMDGAQAGRQIISSYIDQDQYVVNDQARRKYLVAHEGDPSLSAREMAQYIGEDVTLAAMDVGKTRDLVQALNQLALALTAVDQPSVARARSFARSYLAYLTEQNDVPAFIDIGSFLDMLQSSLKQQAGSRSLAPEIQAVRQAISQAVVAEKHGSQRSGSTGFSIYFPNSQLFNQTASQYADPSYTGWTTRFTTASLWDNFLRFHYTSQDFDGSSANLSVLSPEQAAVTLPTPTAAPVEGQVIAPGASAIQITNLQASATRVNKDGKITLSADVSGANIGYIYLFTAYGDPQSGQYLIANIDFVRARDTKSVNGVYYPDWGTGQTVHIQSDWEPTLYYLSNGDRQNDALANFEPEVYGRQAEENIYTVRGMYTFRDTGERRAAMLRLIYHGEMKNVLVFQGQDYSGAPFDIFPNPGDQFTITEEWVNISTNPNGEFIGQDGGTFSFGEGRLTMVPYYAFPGKYIIGFGARDLDGNQTYQFTEVEVSG